jgi:alpha-mannosidase
VKVVHRGPLRGELAIELVYGSPAGSEGGRCRLALQLDAGLPALRIHVTGDNRAGDHRLRLRVATGLAGASTLADAAFHPVERVPLAISPDEARTERVVPTAPLHRWVARFAGELGATLFSDGLAEYESLSDGAVAVTLLRAVGELSRSDLPERPGHAGWPGATPAAQSIGPFAASFALALHGADSPATRDQIEQLADDVLLPLTGETLRSNLRDPHSTGGLELSGEGLAFSAASPAQRDGWIVLRCVNRRRVAGHGRWRLGRTIAEAQLARMDETPAGPLVVDGDTVEFPAGPGEIVTVLVR